MAITVAVDTYLSVADADAYWLLRNDSVWSAATTAEKEAALVVATQYIDGAYSFIGEVTNYTQSLAFPRASLEIRSGNFKGVYYSSTTIPPQIEAATAELALEALSGTLEPSQSRGGAIKREKVDVIEVEYMDFAPSGKTFNYVSRILSPLTKGSQNTVMLART